MLRTLELQKALCDKNIHLVTSYYSYRDAKFTEFMMKLLNGKVH